MIFSTEEVRILSEILKLKNAITKTPCKLNAAITEFAIMQARFGPSLASTLPAENYLTYRMIDGDDCLTCQL